MDRLRIGVIGLGYVGLPLIAIHRLLVAAGVTVPVDPNEAYLRWLKAQGKEPLPCPPTFP